MNTAQPRKDTKPVGSHTLELVLLTGMFVIPAVMHALAVILA